MSLLTAFVLIGLVLTVLAMFNGIVSMAHGGEEDLRASHWLMLKRVGWQALTALLVLLALLEQVK
jgi:hypothetical protein